MNEIADYAETLKKNNTAKNIACLNSILEFTLLVI